MWIFFSGYILTIVFNHLIMKLYKKNFLNKELFLFEKFLGWFFQEHIRQDYYVTTGKRFMLKKDFRNRFITQSIKVIRNTVFWIHILNILELGTLILSFVVLIYLLSHQSLELVKIFKTQQIKLSMNLIYIKTYNIIKYKNIILLLLILFFYRYIVMKTYSLFDLLFVLKPFLFLFIIISNFTSIFCLVYLIYLYLLIQISLNLGGFLNILFYKFFLYFIISLILLNLIIVEINFENFCKEILFKILFYII